MCVCVCSHNIYTHIHIYTHTHRDIHTASGCKLVDVDCYCYFKQALAFITEWNLSISVDTSGLRKHIIDVNSKAVYA